MRLRLSAAKRVGLHGVRIVSLVVVAALGTVVLMREAPGYFSDVRETDARYAGTVQGELAERKIAEASLGRMLGTTLKQWMHGDLGRSREFDVPVRGLIAQRMMVSARLLLGGVGAGWLFALALALPLAARRGAAGEGWIAAPAALLLAIPTGAMATVCLLLDFGGPMLVLATIIGVRDFKLIYRLLRQTWNDPCLVHARAQGISAGRITRVHLLPRMRSRMVALATMSFVLALSAIVPVEVIFNVAGVGQLAWSAALNRDLPVLLAVTLVMALGVGAAGVASEAMNGAGNDVSNEAVPV